MFSKFSTFLTLVLGIGVLGCVDENELEPGLEPVSKTSIDFVDKDLFIESAGDSLPLGISLDQMPTTDGQVSIQLGGTARYGLDYTTNPSAEDGVIELPILKGKQFYEVAVYRSSTLDTTDRQVSLTLLNPSEAFQLGTEKVSNMHLVKSLSEEPNNSEGAEVNFADSFVHLMEGEDYLIELTIEGSVEHTVPLTISIVTDGRVYGTHFTTSPASVLGEIDLEVNPGMESVFFSFNSINDRLSLGTFAILFQINDLNDDLTVGNNPTLTVKIEEDDVVSNELHSIAELRAKFEEHGDQFWLGDDYFIKGVITSGSNVQDDKIAYIQDSTGGIFLRFSSERMVTLGDHVQLNLKGATGALINGQKGMMDVNDLVGIKIAEKVYVQPEIITFEGLHSGLYQGKKVRIDNVFFPQANGVRTFEGSWAISNDHSGATVTTYSGAEFSGVVLPNGTLSVIGIVGDWGRILPQTYAQDIRR